MGGPGSGRRANPDDPTYIPNPRIRTPAQNGPLPHVRPFNGAKFVAWISSVTPNRAGVRINMMVKFQDREDVKDLWDAIGVPVEVEMREWEMYRQAKDVMEGKIVVPE